MTLSRWSAAAIAALACAGAQTWAQQQGSRLRLEQENASSASSSPRLASVIAQLGSPDFKEREVASRALLSQAQQLEAELARGAFDVRRLSPEQRLRIEDALKTSFAQSPRPGMGIQFAPAQPGVGALMIQRVVPNFPASALLRAGDSIVAIDGERLSLHDERASARVRQHILSYRPGDAIEVVVQRAGERLILRVPLGRYDQLDNQQNVPPADDLLQAWEIRRRRLGIALREPEPITPTPLSAGAGQAPEAPLTNAGAIQWYEERAGVLPGGAPTMSPEVAPAAFGGAILAQRIEAQSGRLRGNGVQPSNVDRRSDLFRRLQVLRLTEAQLRSHAANPNVPPEAREAAREQLEEVRREISEVTKSIRGDGR